MAATSASAGDRQRVRQFPEADLIDFMLVVVPIVLGEGVSLWEGSSGIENRFDIESVTSASALTTSAGRGRNAPEAQNGRGLSLWSGGGAPGVRSRHRPGTGDPRR